MSESRGLGDTIAKITEATGISWFAHKAATLIGLADCGCAERQELLNQLFPYRHAESEFKLTIAMSTFDEWSNVWFTFQSLRMFHADVMKDVELLIVDNNPGSVHGKATKKLVESYANGKGVAARYVPYSEAVGTVAAVNEIFHRARGEAVLVIDSHVLIEPGAIRRLIGYFESGADDGNLLHGPMIYDDLNRAGAATGMIPKWSGGMWGVWDHDERGQQPNGQPYEIWGHGAGLFACRRSDWPGLNPHMRGFGGFEGYAAAKFRSLGKKAICLPWLGWNHQFRQDGMPRPYSAKPRDMVRNHLLAFFELGLDVSEPIRYYTDELTPADWRELLTETSTLAGKPQTFDIKTKFDLFFIGTKSIGIETGRLLWNSLAALESKEPAITIEADRDLNRLVSFHKKVIAFQTATDAPSFHKLNPNGRHKIDCVPSDHASHAEKFTGKLSAVICENGDASAWKRHLVPGGIFAMRNGDGWHVETVGTPLPPAANRRPDPINVAVVTIFKGRHSHLKQTFPDLLRQRVSGRFKLSGMVAVDYDCPQDSGGWVALQDPGTAGRIVLVQVDNRPIFNPCHARNIGVRAAVEHLDAQYVLLIDCDYRPRDANSLQIYLNAAGEGALIQPWINGKGNGDWCGTCLVNVAAFNSVRGYDESISGYGGDDTNFYFRLQNAGFQVRSGPDAFDEIPHGDDERDRFLSRKIDPANKWSNSEWAFDPSRSCNPNGFGIFEGTTTIKGTSGIVTKQT